MTLKSLASTIGVCGLLLLLHAQGAKAGELIIHDEGALTVMNDSILLMNCNDLTIETGGTFTLNGGTVEKRGRLTLENGGQYIILSGTLDKCFKSFYVIPGPNGKNAIICL